MTETVDYQALAKDEGKEAAKKVMRLVNRFGAEGHEEFINGIVWDHPTLQANFGRVMFAMIRIWADKYQEERYDARNEALCLACHDIVMYMDAEREGWDFAPFI